MRIETLLPLGKVDPGLRAPETPFDITTVAEKARLLEDIGYDGLVCEETKDDPFIVLALAAQATTRLHLTTGVAIAFPRSPTVTAMTAWTLQKLSNGRFTLGLGTQVRAHIERRFGMKWSPAAPWISEYIAAARSPPRSDPANSHAFLPTAIPRSARSAALLVRQIRPSSMNLVKAGQRLRM